MTIEQNAAIADLKGQFEHVVAQWHLERDEAEAVRVQAPSDGCWLLAVHTPRFLTYRLTPPRSLWLASWQVSTKVPELALIGAAYQGEHRLIVVAEWKRPVDDIETADDLERSFARWLSLPDVKAPKELFADPVRQIAASRSIRALLRILRNADQEAVEEVASQSSDVAVAVRALEQPEALNVLTEEDPLAEAKLRGIRAKQRLLTEEGGTWSVDDVATHLQLTRQAVNRRRKQGTLLGLDAGRHGFRYPAWQFTTHGTIPGLEQVLHALRHVGPWMQQVFILSTSTRLKDRRAVDVLREGDINAVVKAASVFLVHGAA